MIAKLTFLAILGLALAFIIRLSVILDLGKQVYNHRPGPCRTVAGIKHGSEDIEVVKELSVAFITSGLYYMQERAPEVKGQIFLYDFAQPIDNQTKTRSVVPLKINGKFDRENFYPHGISSIISNGKIRLYVISHTKKFEHSVEVFDFDHTKRELNFVKTIKNSEFKRPNNIIAVGLDQFILSNDGSGQNTILNFIELAISVKAGNVIYYDGQVVHHLVPSEISPNGIALSKNKEYLIVSSPNEKTLVVYKLSKDFKHSTQVSRIDLGSAPDNVIVDESNSAWVGTHPILYQAFKYCLNPDDLNVKSPSRILRVAFTPDFSKWTITEPYSNDGSEVSGSSVAAYYRGQLLIGTIYRTLLQCDVVHLSVL
ncbi:hypothetical protein AB6A40_004638 [Gnathostoma spinigerum]|uniref:Paraoxonase n=1 Tax=Gnathostoma spinigerum TaxID=75299 RepID=A0ABD6EKR4_9BILA